MCATIKTTPLQIGSSGERQKKTTPLTSRSRDIETLSYVYAMHSLTSPLMWTLNSWTKLPLQMLGVIINVRKYIYIYEDGESLMYMYICISLLKTLVRTFDLYALILKN